MRAKIDHRLPIILRVAQCVQTAAEHTGLELIEIVRKPDHPFFKDLGREGDLYICVKENQVYDIEIDAEGGIIGDLQCWLED